jgi:cell division septation protein DedD
MAYLEPLRQPDRPSIPYRRIRRHSHRGLVTSLAAAVMVLCAGGLWIAHMVASRDGAEDVPLLHAETDPVKVKPADPGGMDIPNQNRSYVFDQGSAQPPEHLMPPPETPLPRPSPAQIPAPATPAFPPPEQADSSLPVAPSASAAETSPAPPVAALAVPRPPQTAALPPASPAATPGKGYRLQIAAVKTQDAAKEEWDRIRRQNSDILGSLSFIADRVDLGDRGVFYRVQAGPITDAQEGDRICTMLRQRNVGCILVKP